MVRGYTQLRISEEKCIHGRIPVLTTGLKRLRENLRGEKNETKKGGEGDEGKKTVKKVVDEIADNAIIPGGAEISGRASAARVTNRRPVFPSVSSRKRW